MIGQPKNYSEMLKRIFYASLFAGLACTVTLGLISPDVQAFLNLSSQEWELGPLRLPIVTVLIPLAAAILARVFTLHDIISDILHIRERFETVHILARLANGVGISIDTELRQLLRENRKDLMRQAFYKYAMDGDRAIINSQLVVTALDRWGWFWSLLEPSVIVILAGIVAWCLVSFSHALPYLVVAVAMWVLAFILWLGCARAAHDEVADILDDQHRQKKVKQVFDALQN